MGRSHGGARDTVRRRVACIPGRHDAVPRGKEVEATSVVGEPGALVATGGCAYGNRHWFTGRRTVAGVYALVASRYHVHHSCRDRGAQSKIERISCATAQAHVGHGGLDMVGGDPIDTGDHA